MCKCKICFFEYTLRLAKGDPWGLGEESWFVVAGLPFAKMISLLCRGGFCQFPFHWIYYCHISISIGKETGEMQLCAFGDHFCKRIACYNKP